MVVIHTIENQLTRFRGLRHSIDEIFVSDHLAQIENQLTRFRGLRHNFKVLDFIRYLE